ncbi:hypothetical protein AMAG_13253, partial [Allomyces macrogynus ATCC 38327]
SLPRAKLNPAVMMMMRNDRARAERTPPTAAAATSRSRARPSRPSRTLADEIAQVGVTTATRGPTSSPYHVAFLALGSRGDVQPVLAAALALRDASVPGTLRLSILAPPDFAPWIGQHQGIQFCSIRAPEESSTRPSSFFASALLSSSPRALLAIMRRFTPPLVEQMDEILDHTRKADLVVCGVLSNMQGALLARRVPPGRRTPPTVVSLATFPCVHPTTQFPMPLAGRPTLVFGWMHWISFLVRELLFWLFLASLIQGCCRAAHVRMWPSFWAYWRDLRKMPHFFAMSPTLCRVPADWPPHATAFQGHLMYQTPAPARAASPATLSPNLATFLRRTARDSRGRRRPIIYVGFGSMPVCVLPSFLPLIRGLHAALVTRAAAARSPTPRLVVYAGGIAPDTTPYGTAFARLAELAPEDLIPVTAEPHAILFPLCRVIVHHGGAGTAMAALAAGVPSVITPCAVDQPFWADRVHKLGCAPKPVRYTKLTAEKLGKMIWEVLVDRVGKYQTAALAAKERIVREDGAGEVVAWLSGFVPPHIMAKEEPGRDQARVAASSVVGHEDEDGSGNWSSDDGTGSRTPPPPYREAAAEPSAASGLRVRPSAVDEKRTLAVLQDARDAAARLLEERYGVIVPSS